MKSRNFRKICTVLVSEYLPNLWLKGLNENCEFYENCENDKNYEKSRSLRPC